MNIIESMIFTQSHTDAPVPSQYFRKVLNSNVEHFSHEDLCYLPKNALKKYLASRKKFRTKLDVQKNINGFNLR